MIKLLIKISFDINIDESHHIEEIIEKPTVKSQSTKKITYPMRCTFQENVDKKPIYTYGG